MSLKKATDYENNDLQVDSALKDAKGQVIHTTYIKKTIPDGTIAKNIGVDSNGDIVKETPSGGGGGTQLYKHHIVIEQDASISQTQIVIDVYNNNSTSYTTGLLTGIFNYFYFQNSNGEELYGMCINSFELTGSSLTSYQIMVPGVFFNNDTSSIFYPLFDTIATRMDIIITDTVTPL